ncbi:MAG: hypothetical protein O7G84_01265 [Gammaproteobacteria bacterium]|nr:hypothetical protein [Gammaproteobacteria bacterium]
MKEDPELMVAGMWSLTFNLPPNDPRLLQVSAREAMEHMVLFQAAKALETENISAAAKQSETQRHHDNDPYSPNFRPDTKTVVGEEAEKVADKPLPLTGDAEWDEVELAETDPMREPFDDAFVADFLKGA